MGAALAPLIVGIIGIVIERTMLARLYKLDHLYGLLLTFGLALIIQGMFASYYGARGNPIGCRNSLPARAEPRLHVSCRNIAPG